MAKKHRGYIESCWNEIEKRPSLKVVEGGKKKKTFNAYDFWLKFIATVVILALIILLLGVI